MLGAVLKDLMLPRRGAPRIDSGASTVVRSTARQQEGGNILGFSAGSEGNALAELTRELLAPFASRAKGIRVFDLGRAGWRDELEAALDEPVWFAAAYAALGQDIRVMRNGTPANLWESAGIPFVRFFGDIPAYFPDRHVAHHGNSINAYSDAAHAAFHRRWFAAPALTVLHPRIVLDEQPVERIDVESKLDGRIIFPKNGNSPGQLLDYWRMALPGEIAGTLEALAEESVGTAWIDREPCFDERLIDHFGARGIDIAVVPDVLCFLVAQLDDYVRRVKSTMIAKAILDLPVIVRGRFWQHVDFHGKRAIYDPNSDVASTQALIDRAPALIDMSPNTQHSPHDRICRAAGRGTAFLTNRQQFIDALLPAVPCTFGFAPEEIGELVERYATNPREAVEMGLEQARVLRAALDRRHYVASVLAAVQTTELRMGGRPAGTQDFVDFPPELYP